MEDILFWAAYVLSAFKVEEIIEPIEWKPAGLLGLIAMMMLAALYAVAVTIGVTWK